jgi:hypothetical protein
VNKNAKIVSIAAILGLIVIFAVFVGRDLFLRRQNCFDCGDGKRCAIDIRDFTSKYSTYSVELEASVADKAKISAKLNPAKIQQLSEATQSVRDFRQYVVAGYNSCAVTKAQYSQFGTRFQALDNLAREINALTGKSSLSAEESARVATLISQYGDLAHKLGTD